MAKDPQKLRGDIAEEKYQGANEAVAGLGYGAIETKFAWLGGLIIGGVGAFLSYKHLHPQIVKAQKWAVKASELEGSSIGSNLQQGAGKFVAWVIGRGDDAVASLNIKEKSKILHDAMESKRGGFAHTLADELAKFVDWIARGFKEERGPNSFSIKKFIGGSGPDSQHKLDTVILGGGVTALAAMVGATFWGGKHGVDTVVRSKDQFKRAQREIRELREDLQFVEEKNAELRSELRDTKEKQLSVSKDEAPAVKEIPVVHPDPAPENPQVLTKRKDEPAPVQLENASDRGDGHARHTHTETNKTAAVAAKSPDKAWGEHIRERQSADAEQSHQLTA